MYPDERVARFITDNFIPVKAHVKQQPETFQRFHATWTPTQLVLEPDGTERSLRERHPAGEWTRKASVWAG